MTSAVHEIGATARPERDALASALGHLAAVQGADGCWEGEVVWNPMLLAQYVFVRRILGRPIPEAERAAMIRHFRVTRTPEGGWGMHPESGPYVFFTTLSYVALRLLGASAEDPLVADARRWLRAQPGGVLAIPSWGKFWLAVLGLYGYEGVNPIPPELFVLPRALPFHPDRFYCHTRYIYLGIASLYGRRFTADLGPIVHELRRELHAKPYASIDFASHRHDLAESDLFVRPSLPLRLAYDALHRLEARRSRRLRSYALARCFERIVYEVRTSRHLGLSPVNHLLNILAIHATDPAHPDLEPAIRGMDGWRWQDEAEGIRFAGARSNAWDTALAMRAALEAPASARTDGAVRRAYAYLRDTQIDSELPGGAAARRDPALGGWCFSDGRHRWPVSDCTAEALSATLAAHGSHGIPGRLAPRQPVPRGDAAPAVRRIPDARLRDAVEFILLRQNDDGGFGTYERRRAGALLEALNPSEMYGSCMTERSYLECTASSIGALARYRTARPDLCSGALGRRVNRAVAAGERFLRASQREDGAWPGFWGIHYTYAIFHVVEALRAVGAEPDDPAIARAAAWLAGHQKADGGWGEHYTSCLEDRYVEHPESQATMTAWAVLALLSSGSARSAATRRGLAWLRDHQLADGSWPKQSVAGVFFGTAMLDYRLYKDVFPTWALARAAALHPTP